MDTVIRDNVADYAGGGFLFFHATLQGVDVSDNSAVDNGGALLAQNGCMLLMANLTVYRNEAGTAGGAAHLTDSSFNCEYCDLGEGADDNLPDDITLQWDDGSQSYSAGVQDYFSCGAAGQVCYGL